MNKKVAIVDYGMGNLHSLFRVFTRLQIQAIVSCDPKEISEASHVVLPGVGHFGRAMDELRKRDLLSVINDVSLDYRKPMLGICLGMQLMTQGSEEGDCAGLGWFNGKTSKLKMDPDSNLKVPHLGWNTLENKKDHAVMNGLMPEDAFYFVHGFAVLNSEKDEVLCTTSYGVEFTSGLVSRNLIGLQFHPEKSHDQGQQVLTNFLNLCTDPD